MSVSTIGALHRPHETARNGNAARNAAAAALCLLLMPKMATTPKQVFRILKGERSAAMNRIANFLSRLPADKDFKVEISELKARRTESQNALLWSLYGDILQKGGETLGGWETEDLHELFLIEHYGAEQLSGIGARKRLKPLKRSSGLTKTEFSEHIDFIVRYMAEQGVVLKLPGDPQWR